MELNAERVEQVICTQCNATVNTTGLSPFSVVTCQSCGKKLHVPARIENLLLLKPIGKGGMGVVYRALDTSLRRTVAVKVLKKDDDKEDAERARMILQEARSLALLNHPNVVHVFSIGTAGEQPYIVMELVDGGRFDKLFADNEPGDEVTSLQITIDAAEGLRAALNAGLVHGDVKPGNILLNQDGIAKIIDFGIARKVDDDSGHGFIGTPYYVAPEIVRGHKLDHRCDIYSLGASLFNVLTGKRPFTGKDVPAIVRARLETRPPNVRALIPTLHPETAHVVDQMLEPDPEQRYQSYDDLIEDLRHALAASQAGPVDMQMAELSAAAFEQHSREVDTSDIALDQSYSRGSRTSSHSRASRTRTRQRTRGTTQSIRSKRPQPKAQQKGGGSTGLIIGAVITAVIAIVAIVVAFKAGGGGGFSPNQRMDETFQNGVIPEDWKHSGLLMMDTSNHLEIVADSNQSSLRRSIGNVSGSVVFDLNNIRWNRRGTSQFTFRLDDGGVTGLEVWMKKEASKAPKLLLYQLSGGEGKELASTDLDSNASSITIKITYTAVPRTARVSYTDDFAANQDLGGDVAINSVSESNSLELGLQTYGGKAFARVKRISWIPQGQ